MADHPGRGLGTAQILLIGVVLCVMSAVGVAAASALSAPEVPVTAYAESAPVVPVVPAAETVEPPADGARVSGSWTADAAARTGISEVAVQAYGTAVLRLAAEQPGCRIGWTTLAGIGGVESLHGTDGGGYLLPDGLTSQPILGPALDGSEGLAAIRSTPESVRWHGDGSWDHAVGPMQFIPSTWERWQSDGNDDGIADPANVFDAAYAAGRYLCASGADLSTGAGWTRAIWSYNHSDDYVRTVLAFANSYAH